MTSGPSSAPVGGVRAVLALSLVLGLGTPMPTWAEPPPWAPAWGYRDKSEERDHGHKGKDERKSKSKHEYDDDSDYEELGRRVGIARGRCDGEQLGAIAGGVLGGALGAQVGDGDGRIAAIVAGTLVGMVVGSRIGRWMDQTDQQCIGQTLERAADGQRVVWTSQGSGARFSTTPTRTFRRDGRYCRDYRTVVESSGSEHRQTATACRDQDGIWHPMES